MLTDYTTAEALDEFKGKVVTKIVQLGTKYIEDDAIGKQTTCTVNSIRSLQRVLNWIDSPFISSDDTLKIIYKYLDDECLVNIPASPYINAPYTIGNTIGGSFSGFIDWNVIINAPTTFPPSAHTHSYNSLTDVPISFPTEPHNHLVADISDFPTEFPPSVHTHSYNDLNDLPPAAVSDASEVTYTPADINNVTGFWAGLLGTGSTFVALALDRLATYVLNLSKRFKETAQIVSFLKYPTEFTTEHNITRVSTTGITTMTIKIGAAAPVALTTPLWTGSMNIPAGSLVTFEYTWIDPLTPRGTIHIEGSEV